jgi:hypothetical protein
MLMAILLKYVSEKVKGLVEDAVIAGHIMRGYRGFHGPNSLREHSKKVIQLSYIAQLDIRT